MIFSEAYGLPPHGEPITLMFKDPADMCVTYTLVGAAFSTDGRLLALRVRDYREITVLVDNLLWFSAE